MKFAFSLMLKDDATARPLLEMIAAAGFQGVEPTFGLSGTLPAADDPRRSAERMREMAEAVGLKVPSMRGGPGFWPLFASRDPEQRGEAVELARKALDAVKILGGDTLLIVPGQWEPGRTYQDVWDSARDTARRVAELAERVGVKVGLENVENRFPLSPRDWMQFLDEVDSPWVRMYFDVGNVVYLGLGHPEQWIRHLGRRYITRIHFKDAMARGALTYLLEGQVDWPAVRDAIRDVGYDDWIGIELVLPTHHVGAMLAGTYRAAETIMK